MKPNFDLICSGCRSTFPFGTYSCPHKDGVLIPTYHFSKKATFKQIITPSGHGIWRFSKVLPNVSENISLEEGRTPLLPSRSYGKELGIKLYVKDEGRNPSGSFKDRAASVLLSVEKELGHLAIATATSGNAGGALALYSRLAGIQANIFMFHPTESKFLHTCSYSPEIFLVDCEDESKVITLTKNACRIFGWSWLTTMSEANPFNIEGYKIIAYEIVEEIDVPDVVVTPMASGTLALGIWKGMNELLEMKLISKMPRIIGIQSAGINPIAKAFDSGSTKVHAVSGKTIAGGLGLDNPGLSGESALKAIRKTNGAVLSVTDAEIANITFTLPLREGIFPETSGASSVAGVILARNNGLIGEGETVVCINSASGFKDLRAFEARTTENNVHQITPSTDSVRQALSQ
jgi:threonine synthase